ncbi:YgjP-like metallopeptidase domain-containing protein [Mesomycoplasma hyorhinis]|uniref:YgjP-like metallopeptidase domain-containing protein n=1 Tax=Mesomycoplasma hyorhinis TaxID=2100 RepID=UPI001C05C436|nr:YgjP-like metallopeptidase domain-containing protein [Mesomycoplasma hyorhinis]
MNSKLVYLYNGVEYEVIIEKKNYKNLKFTVRLDHGKLRVLTNCSLEKIKQNLELLKPKIDELLLNSNNLVPINLEQKYFYFLGQKCNFNLIKTNNEYFLYAQNLVFKLKSINKNTIKLQIIDNINKKLLKYIKTRILYWSKIMHTPDFEVFIRNKTSAWATNHISKRKIYFSKKLFPFSKNSLDYVIIHELAHFYFNNHSDKFWNLVAQYKPDYLEIRKKINRNQYD